MYETQQDPRITLDDRRGVSLLLTANTVAEHLHSAVLWVHFCNWETLVLALKDSALCLFVMA